MRQVRREDTPPKSGDRFWIIRVRANQTKEVVAAGKLWGFWTHWDGKKSIPCTGADKSCYGHERGLPLRWKGFVWCYDLEKRAYCYVEITPLMAEQINQQLPEGEALRGWWLQFRRGNGDKSRCKVVVERRYHTPEALLPDRDPIKTLSDLWDLTDKKVKSLDRKPVDQ